MKTQSLMVLSLFSVLTCAAEHTVTEYEWKKLADVGQLLSGNVAVVDGRTVLKIENTNSTAFLAPLLKIQKPGISNTFYAIRGEIKYENVLGNGYLEMWNHFPPITPGMPEGQFFTKTLGESGEMGKISGTSKWRKFSLPFDSTGASGPPTKLELNLMLPGKGTVYLSSLLLAEWPGNPFHRKGVVAGQWWSDQRGGLIGGVLGSILGVIGGLLAWLAARGKSRRFVLVTYQLLIGCGGLSFVAAMIALITHQTYGVWFPLLLVGVLLLSIFPFRLKQTRRVYEDLELRRMAAIDAT
jgi:hypothetical protein